MGFVAPLLITAAIVFVTGIPPTEEQAVKTRGDAYREYQRTTSVIVPWFPRTRAPPGGEAGTAGVGSPPAPRQGD